MAKFEKGDVVINTEDVNTGFFDSIKKGTEGVVISTGLFSSKVEVKFDNGEKATCDESKLRKL